jgi:hypothetical protein
MNCEPVFARSAATRQSRTAFLKSKIYLVVIPVKECIFFNWLWSNVCAGETLIVTFSETVSIGLDNIFLNRHGLWIITGNGN